MIPTSHLRLLKNLYPQISMGSEDYRAGRWRDVVGNNQSFAYEVGRQLAIHGEKPAIGGFVDVGPEAERAIRELCGAG